MAKYQSSRGRRISVTFNHSGILKKSYQWGWLECGAHDFRTQFFGTHEFGAPGTGTYVLDTPGVGLMRVVLLRTGPMSTGPTCPSLMNVRLSGP